MADIATLGIEVDSRDVLTAVNDLTKLVKEGAKADTGTQKLNKSFKATEVASKAMKVGITGAVAGVTAFAGAIAASTVTFAEYEAGMIGVQKTTDLSAKEMGVFEEEIQKIARSVPIATTSLLTIAETAGQLGVKGAENIGKFTKTLAQLELATDVVGDEGAKSIARLLTVTGDGIETVESFGSVLVALGNSSAASESEILSMGTQIGLATSAFEVSSTSAIAMGAAMKSLGISSELGGSVVGKAMRVIEDAVNSGGEKMQELSRVTGMTSTEIQKGFGEDATKVFQSWVEGVGDVIKGGGSAAEELEKFGLRGEEVLKVLPSMAVNSDILSKSLDTMNDELEQNTALQNEADKAASGLSAQWQVIKNIISEVAVAIGKESAPAMKESIDQFKAWWEINDKIVKQNIASFFDKTFKAIATSVEVIGDVATTVGNAWTQIEGFVGYSIGSILISWENYLYAVDRGLLAIKSSFVITFDKILEVAATAVDKMAEGFGMIPVMGKDIETAMNGAADGMRNVSTASENYGREVEVLKTTHDNLIGVLEEEQESYLELGVVNTEVNTTQIGLEENLKEIVLASTQEKEEAIKTSYDNVDTKAKEIIGIGGTVGTYFSDLKESVVGEGGSATTTFSDLDLKFGELEETSKETLNGSGSGLTFEFGSMSDEVGNEIVPGLMTNLDGHFDNLKSKTGEVLTTDSDSMTNKFGVFGEDVQKGFNSDLTEWFGDVGSGEFGSIGDAWDGLWKGMLGTVVDTVAAMGANFIVDSLVSSFFHEGTMGLKNDEYKAVLQAGEIVIPQKESELIRGNLGEGASFDGIVNATSTFDHKEAISTGSPVGKSQVTQAAETIGGIAGYSAVSFSPMSQTAGAKNIGTQVGSAVVGAAATSLADWGDVRENEGIRDAYEMGLINDLEAHNFAAADKAAGVDNTTSFSRAAGAFNDAISQLGGYKTAAAEHVKSLFQSAQDAITGDTEAKRAAAMDASNRAWAANYDDVDSETADFDGFGTTQQEADNPGSTGRNGGDAADNQGSAGGGSADDDGGAGWGFNQGGVVNRLMVPKGEDGFAALKLNESVNDVEATNMLKTALKNGGLSGGNNQELISVIRSLGISLLRISNDSNRMLGDWDIRGLPATRTV